MSIGEKISSLQALLDTKKLLNEELKIITHNIESLSKRIITILKEENIEGATDGKLRVRLENVVHPSVQDWNLFYKHIIDSKDFTYLQKRVSSMRLKEDWDAGTDVPGVEKVELTELKHYTVN